MINLSQILPALNLHNFFVTSQNDELCILKNIFYNVVKEFESFKKELFELP